MSTCLGPNQAGQAIMGTEDRRDQLLNLRPPLKVKERRGKKPRMSVKQKEEEEERAERAREKQSQIPQWATRLVPGCGLHCVDVAENEDAVDSTARIIDNLSLMHVKDSYRIFYLYMVSTPAQTYIKHVRSNGMIPEYDENIPFVGEDAHGDFREPTEEEYKITFERISKSGKFDNRDLEMYLGGVEGLKFLCKLMKYLVQTGVTPQVIANKLNDVADADDENKAEVRREVTDFVRKIIAGAFAIRSYDYFRVNPPEREDHLHVDPVSLVCAVTERVRSFAVMVTLNIPRQGWRGITRWT